MSNYGPLKYFLLKKCFTSYVLLCPIKPFNEMRRQKSKFRKIKDILSLCSSCTPQPLCSARVSPALPGLCSYRHCLGGGGGADSTPVLSREPKVVERWARHRWEGLTLFCLSHVTLTVPGAGLTARTEAYRYLNLPFHPKTLNRDRL